MEHSEIILIALILLIVFAGFQVQKLVALFRRSGEAKAAPEPVKTVVSAAAVKMPVHKTVAKKKAPVKKAATKKPATKKSSVHKRSVKN